MNIFLKKTSVIWIIVLLELVLLRFFWQLGSSYHYESETSLNGFLIEFGSYQFILAAYSPRLVKWLLSVYIFLCILVISKGLKTPCFFSTPNLIQVSPIAVFVNIASLIFLSSLLFIVESRAALISHPGSWQSIIYTLSPLAWGLFLYSICNLLFPIKQFFRLAFKNWILFPVFLVGLFIFFPGVLDSLLNFWSDLILIPTIQLSSSIAELFGLNYRVLPYLEGGYPVFGSAQFKVNIYPACSGYEGMSLIIILIAGYCYFQRDNLRVMRALLIIPIACLMMFLLNGLRIFILVAIGHFWSPQLAIDGFHIVGGWLNLLLTFILALLVLNLSFFQKETKCEVLSELGDTVLLLPLMSLILVSLLTKAIAPDFAWLYPIHIAVAMVVLYAFKTFFLSFLTRPSLFSVAIGVVVFILWIILIPENPSQSALFFENLNTAPLMVAIPWLLLRVFGASVIIPIAEELTFRGYVQPHLQSWFEKGKLKSISAIASLVITALLFGYVHSDILAGFLAGLLFGLVYLHRRQLIDAVVAHAVTNALLAVYVISFGYWSYW